MKITKEDAVQKARKDLANRLNLRDDEIREQSVEEADFPDMALGAPKQGEMSGQMITRGWRISLEAQGKNYEYRAGGNQLRIVNYKGQNDLI
ncbi:MAG: hypothetical protein ABR555_10250 [Pyrinomonadaceae bacterium]